MTSFWHHIPADELARQQGITEPQRIEDLQTDLELTPEEIAAFFGEERPEDEHREMNPACHLPT